MINEIEAIRKRCQVGFPRHLSHHDAIHDLLADCYRVLGRLNTIDYRHLSDHEIKIRVEQFGTENEQEILRRFLEPNWELCPHCYEKEREMDRWEEDIADAVKLLYGLIT